MLAAMLLGSLLCVVGFARQAQEARTRWEYQTACAHTSPASFNKLGDEGWELTAVTQDGHVTCFYFKRRK